MINFDPCYRNAKKIELKTLTPGATFAIALDSTEKAYLLLDSKTIENGDVDKYCFAVGLSTGEVSKMSSFLPVIPLDIRAEIYLS